MSRKYRKYLDSDIITYASQVTTMSALLRKLNLRCAGGNFANMKKKIQALNVDCSHWDQEENRAWNKGKQLKDWSNYNKIASLKPHLISERGHKCERCNLTEWLGEKIPLEIDHVNGDRTDNKKENLKLLCCNCHSLTPTWRGRNARNSQNEN